MQPQGVRGRCASRHLPELISGSEVLQPTLVSVLSSGVSEPGGSAVLESLMVTCTGRGYQLQ